MVHSNRESSKAGLREQLSGLRRDFEQTGAVIAGLNRNLEALVKQLQPRVIAGYLPFGNEPDIEGFLRAQLSSQRKVIMPVSNPDHTMTWVSWHGEHRKPGIYAFDEAFGEPADLEEADLVLVPALAATIHGARLGKGKGYYDRALAAFAGATAAIVFDSEVLENLPSEDHDQTVNFVITQTRLISAS